MNKYNVGDVVKKDNQEMVIIKVVHTNIGYVYDSINAKNEIEVCFEHSLEKVR